MSFWRELLDPNSNVSAGRFAVLLAVIMSNCVVWYVFLFVCVWTRAIHDIPMGVVTALGFVNSAAFLGQVGQKFAERPTVGTTTTTETASKTVTGDTKDEDRRDRDKSDMDRRA